MQRYANSKITNRYPDRPVDIAETLEDRREFAPKKKAIEWSYKDNDQPQATLLIADGRRLGAGAVWAKRQERWGGKQQAPISCPSAGPRAVPRGCGKQCVVSHRGQAEGGGIETLENQLCRVMTEQRRVELGRGSGGVHAVHAVHAVQGCSPRRVIVKSKRIKGGPWITAVRTSHCSGVPRVRSSTAVLGKPSRSTSLSRMILDFPDREPVPARLVPAYHCNTDLRFIDSGSPFMPSSVCRMARYFDRRPASAGCMLSRRIDGGSVARFGRFRSKIQFVSCRLEEEMLDVRAVVGLVPNLSEAIGRQRIIGRHCIVGSAEVV